MVWEVLFLTNIFQIHMFVSSNVALLFAHSQRAVRLTCCALMAAQRIAGGAGFQGSALYVVIISFDFWWRNQA